MNNDEILDNCDNFEISSTVHKINQMQIIHSEIKKIELDISMWTASFLLCLFVRMDRTVCILYNRNGACVQFQNICNEQPPGHCTIVSPHRFTAAPLYHCTAVLTIPLYYNTTVSLYHYSAHCTTVPLYTYQCSFALLTHCTTVPLYHCTTILRYQTVPLNHRTTMP